MTQLTQQAALEAEAATAEIDRQLRTADDHFATYLQSPESALALALGLHMPHDFPLAHQKQIANSSTAIFAMRRSLVPSILLNTMQYVVGSLSAANIKEYGKSSNRKRTAREGAFPAAAASRVNKKEAFIFGGRVTVGWADGRTDGQSFHTCRPSTYLDLRSAPSVVRTCLSLSPLPGGGGQQCQRRSCLLPEFHQVEDLCTQMDGRMDGRNDGRGFSLSTVGCACN